MSILRIHIPQPGYVRLCLPLKDIVPLAPVPLPILPPQENRYQTIGAPGRKHKTQHDCVPQCIPRCVLCPIYER